MLTKRWMGTCVMSIAIGATSVAGLDAQGAQARATDKPDGKKQTVTITGCLQGPLPADEYSLSFGPETAEGTSEVGPTFRLTNVTMKAMPASGATYLVIGSEKQLSAHLGHQVQIVGTIVDAGPRGTTGDTPAYPTADQYTGSIAGNTGQPTHPGGDVYVGSVNEATATAASGSTPAAAAEPTVRVESVRMVSTKCSQRR